jgi:eukaryotic-like serine/threonine-protein kinase
VTPRRWQQIERLFHDALERPLEERAAFLHQSCAGDESLRHEVKALLDSPATAHRFLDRDALEVAADLVSVSQMPVLSGRRLGVYQLQERIGSGGMGEVYRAHDTRLGRDVAIKILPDGFSADPNRQARFEREARVLAALNHPNIGAVYGFEEGVTESGETVRGIILELIEGETLRERVRRRPLSIGEAVVIATQIADALDVAHEKGIIHRDLKPANIKIAPDGMVKVLDFGLAKTIGDDAPFTQSVVPGKTVEGTILGTAAYMSPEQARGQRVDKRTDIWAFGCMLFEMLTGRAPFARETMSDTLAAILEAEPEWHWLPSSTPPHILRLLERCLAKDMKRRIRDIADARIELEEPVIDSSSVARDRMDARTQPGLTTTLTSRRLAWWLGAWIAEGSSGAVAAAMPPRRAGLAWIIAATSIVAAASVVATLATASYFTASKDTAATIRFDVSPPDGTTFPSAAPFFAVSPNGRWLAFTASDASRKHSLWVRSFEGVAARPLAGTDGANDPFWSPDSRFIAFFADGKLKTINISDGSLQNVCDAPTVRFVRGGAWSGSGVIVFQMDSLGPLYGVSASGGTPAPVTMLDQSRMERSHKSPSFLPDGMHFLYSALGRRGDGVFLGSLDSPEGKRLLEAESNAVYTSGHVLFGLNGALMAQRFDLRKLQVSGEPLRIVEQVHFNPITVVAAFSASDTGVLAYYAGTDSDLTQSTWIDRTGKTLASIGEPRLHLASNLSRDGTKIAVDRRDPQTGNWDIWLMDAARGATARLTTHPAPDTYPVWSPDGSRIAFASSRDDPGTEFDTVYLKESNGSSDEQPILKMPQLHLHPLDWSLDGRYVLLERFQPKKSKDLWILPMFGNRTPVPFLETEFDELAGQFSPDGHFVAYASNETGRFEVYVRTFSGSAGKWPISVGGGSHPRWSRDGKEIFYLSADRALMAVAVSTKGPFEAGTPRKLFQTPFGPDVRESRHPYAVAPSGKQFLMMVPSQSPSAPITVTVNWPAALRAER